MKKALVILVTFIATASLFGAISNSEGERVASFSGAGTSTVTGGNLTTNMREGNGGYYDYSTKSEYYLQILSSTAYWSSKPSSVTFKCHLVGEGSSLGSGFYVDCLSQNGGVISSTPLAASSLDGFYIARIPPHKKVYGFRLHHTKSTNAIIGVTSASLSASGISHKYIIKGRVVIVYCGKRFDMQGNEY